WVSALDIVGRNVPQQTSASAHGLPAFARVNPNHTGIRTEPVTKSARANPRRESRTVVHQQAVLGERMKCHAWTQHCRGKVGMVRAVWIVLRFQRNAGTARQWTS